MKIIIKSCGSEWRTHHGRLVLLLGNNNTSPLISVQALILCLLWSSHWYQKPYLRSHRDVAVLDFSYKFDNNMVHIFKPVFYITNLKNDGILSLYQNRCQTQFLKFGKRVQFFTCNNYEPLGSTCDSILICALS